ncbi:MAG: adenylate/guanylate cyclase domain-containing protein [Deltaproteobacteria bacterium]|jgi:class 3 adenylate cyclase/CHASE2 domain-containing sensor protein|nr:adenylate/guanylate cyclase domain-containing protein [Deltaproteobacteria bacterium]
MLRLLFGLLEGISEKGSIASLKFFLPLTLALAALACLLSYPGTSLSLSAAVYDHLLRNRGKTLGGGLEPRIVLVAIDDSTHSSPEGSMAEIFSPGVYALILETLTSAGARAVALHRALPPSSGRLYTAREEEEWWRAYRGARKAGVEVVYGFRYLGGNPVLPSPKYIEVMGEENLGFINLPRDRDFKVRQARTLWPDAFESGHPSFAFLAARTLRPSLTPPADEVFFIDYRDSFLRFSFNYVYRQALDGDLNFFKKYFSGALVLIGDTSSLNLDVYPTPLSAYGRGDWPQTPAVEIQAHAVNTLLKGRLAAVPGTAALFPFFSGLVFLVFLPLVFTGPRFKPWLHLHPALVLVLYCVCAVLAFNRYVLLPAAPGVLVILLAHLTYLLLRGWDQRKESRAKSRALDLYLDPALTGRIVQDPGLLLSRGEKRVCSVFFADLVGFTALSERLPTEDVVDLVNLYYDAMTTGIERYDGFVDKYVGDAVMAVWGAPLNQPGHAVSACLSALAQRELVEDLNRELESLGRERLKALMGLNTGPVVAGNIGGKKHMAYTVMGDAVNLASRLVSANKLYGTTIIASGETAKAASGAVKFRRLDKVRVLGRSRSIEIYEVMGKPEALPPETLQMANFYERALKHYWDRDFAGALARFQRALSVAPQDRPSLMFSERCQAHIARDPGPDWDGVTALEAK